ncbi:hypothetical protein PHMEG_00036425 [Phytophthora megakarya]|uniref:Uncharacterized protein n=1 Tax=Phytophthora megakarya TaxID=4795 RepID=A0A225ULH5_9STRA|nr:hypothetical protein PHMEG_00036425 [Phytophthora megakarya]
MTRNKNMQNEGGHDGSESREPVRSSWRMQGLLPEVHRTLDEVERENRKRNAALRKAAQEALQLLENRTQMDSRNSDLEDDSEVESSESSDRSEDSGSNQPQVEESDEESVVEVMMKTEPSAEDRVSGSPLHPEESEIVEENVDVNVERHLSAVQEETASEDVELPPALTETPLLEVQLAHPTSESQTSRSPVTVDSRDEDMTPA